MAEHYKPRGRQRDSHDLSLSPRDVTRDSLVTNMLLSLDSISPGQGNFSNDEFWNNDSAGDSRNNELANLNQTASAWVNSVSQKQPFSREHGHHISYSSDLDESSRYSSQVSRGRRSNSGSNGPTETSYVKHSAQGRSRNQRRATRVSKSSSSASMDMGYSYGNRTQRSERSRSASLDRGSPQQYYQRAEQPDQYRQSSSGSSVPYPAASQQQASYHQQQASYQHQATGPMSPFRVEFPSIQYGDDDDDDFDAAPTPTVHGGPRREKSIPNMPPPPPPEPTNAQSLERKRSSSSRSLKSSSGRKNQSARETVPPVPFLDLDSAPAPHVGYEKAKDTGADGAEVSKATPQVKERPGFFRRVFGSSKSNSPSGSIAQSPTSQRLPSSSEYSERVSSSKANQESTFVKPVSAPPSRDTSSSHSHHPVLQKRPSSFFRRRKKSVTDDVAPVHNPATAPPVPPVNPIHVQMSQESQVEQPEPSPVSSLRKVMNPYLKKAEPAANSGPSPSPLADVANTASPGKSVGGLSDREEFQREFSPDYEPSPKAKIRTVRSNLKDEPQKWSTSPSTSWKAQRSKADEASSSFLDIDGGSDSEQAPSRGDRSGGSDARKTNGTSAAASPSAHTSTPKTASKRVEAETAPSYPTDSDEDADRSKLALPIEGVLYPDDLDAAQNPNQPQPTSPPSVRADASAQASPKVLGTLETMASGQLDEPEFVVGEPTEDDRRKAQKIYDGNEDFIQRERAAAWMGEEGPVRQRTLTAYMDLYDFGGQSIVAALRQVCGRLVFRAETQQVDRLLVAFSKRWCTCNPHHGFQASDVIHTICYSIMLLNTDLHLADIEQKMTRSQFVKNTMGTIIQALSESAPNAFRRPSILPEKSSHLGVDESKPSLDRRKSFRNSFRPPPNADAPATGQLDIDNDCGPLVKAPFEGSQRAWEEQMEIVLKGIYNSIRDKRLPLFGAEPEKNLSTAPSQSSLSVMGILRRSPSTLSKAPSESQTSTRGRIAESSRNGTSRWTSKSRSRPGLGRNGFSSSRTSFEEGNSLWSPALSSATWSRQSLGRTHTSISQDSIGSAKPRGDYQQSIGFANALSQAIIRDEDANGNETAPSVLSMELPTAQLLEDDSLELAGPPWMKEGMVVHKHHLDGVDKKARDRNWSEVFAVVQKGQISLFSFTNKSARQKSRTRGTTRTPNAPVGGGNWQNNATSVGSFSLRQTLASALPPPGYSRARPHVWALSLPTGAVHLFQVGTPELIREFVTTVNYWSARLSTHPLVGGISNIEYGWSDSIINNALVAAINKTDSNDKSSRPGSSAATGRRSSVQSGSFRSLSFDQGSSTFTHSSRGGKLPGDRIHITEWAPPTQSMRPSNATETEQLAILDAYVKNVENELQLHNQLRSPMLLAFTPRGHNASKAMANWESKSAYLLREIVKFRTYVDCLQQAEARKKEIYAERDLAHRAARGDLMSDQDLEVSSEDEGDVTLRP